MSKPNIHVSIAILRYLDQILVGWREAKQHQGNKYEFPGGKVEQGESPEQACTREIYEEVGIDIQQWHNFDFIRHEYEDVIVHLHLFHAAVQPEQLQLIKSPWTWYDREQLCTLNFPKANDAIIQRLVWPKHIMCKKDLDSLKDLKTDAQLLLNIEPYSIELNELNELQTDLVDQLILCFKTFKELTNELQTKLKTIYLSTDDLYQTAIELPLGKRVIAQCSDLKDVERLMQLGVDAIAITVGEGEVFNSKQIQDLKEKVNIPIFTALDAMNSDFTELKRVD
ncbi:hypothetical protein A3K93_07660 [Acinetobacter sp. NCu2D-2]|uniref:(deoxy)nucleoside triphosphate pyrophosphohydrolase n=1 Tax=Acinetobacter sp. NCu2D-2 TaxID=1608473 RepID=UPI0007CE0523|nr:(deoxy)nucleoside triphosphate pyrophosphohydrolase [Acinetobacter sp. NCu2D-2]ANF82083.1 hypothetical protein A3K93_07660 [Acinetobacter sp. NCu2D-2]